MTLRYSTIIFGRPRGSGPTPAARRARRTLDTATLWCAAAAVTVYPCRRTRRTASVTACDGRPLMTALPIAASAPRGSHARVRRAADRATTRPTTTGHARPEFRSARRDAPACWGSLALLERVQRVPIERQQPERPTLLRHRAFARLNLAPTSPVAKPKRSGSLGSAPSHRCDIGAAALEHVVRRKR